jgi:hypothetical protein
MLRAVLTFSAALSAGHVGSTRSPELSFRAAESFGGLRGKGNARLPP